jgi:hypothetical protein
LKPGNTGVLPINGLSGTSAQAAGQAVQVQYSYRVKRVECASPANSGKWDVCRSGDQCAGKPLPGLGPRGTFRIRLCLCRAVVVYCPCFWVSAMVRRRRGRQWAKFWRNGRCTVVTLSSAKCDSALVGAKDHRWVRWVGQKSAGLQIADSDNPAASVRASGGRGEGLGRGEAEPFGIWGNLSALGYSQSGSCGYGFPVAFSHFLQRYLSSALLCSALRGGGKLQNRPVLRRGSCKRFKRHAELVWSMIRPLGLYRCCTHGTDCTRHWSLGGVKRAERARREQ